MVAAPLHAEVHTPKIAANLGRRPGIKSCDSTARIREVGCNSKTPIQ